MSLGVFCSVLFIVIIELFIGENKLEIVLMDLIVLMLFFVFIFDLRLGNFINIMLFS